MNCWKKGALHCHSVWSDGRALPEVVLQTYKNLGYDFVSITDHNIFQDDPQVWHWINWDHDMFTGMAFTMDALDWSREVLGDHAGKLLETKTLGVRNYIRIKDYETFRSEFEEPGKFLVVPGYEATLGGFKNSVDGYFVTHLNMFNQKNNYRIKYPEEMPQSDVIRAVYEEYKEKAGDTYEESFLMLNHPFWRFWDTDPQALLDVPEIKFFEVCNSGAAPTAPKDPVLTVEKFWDFVLAHRLDRGQGLLYGTATDDSHHYHPQKKAVSGYVDTGFVVVNCPGEFTYAAIVEAMKRGDFYASCGVYLDAVEFDKATKTLQVKVQAEEGVNYKIEFITTKRDFDRTIKTTKYMFDKGFARDLTTVGDDIGRIVKTVDGTVASYTMADDDLYVRAVIHSDKKGRIENPFYYPEYECAWTQPVC